MYLKKIFKKLVVASCLFFTMVGITFANDTSSNNSKESACKMVMEFCQSEFQYNISNRYDLIKMTSAYEDKLEKLTQTSIGTLYIADAYEIYAVKSYNTISRL